jgi:hypothetical protein
MLFLLVPPDLGEGHTSPVWMCGAAQLCESGASFASGRPYRYWGAKRGDMSRGPTVVGSLEVVLRSKQAKDRIVKVAPPGDNWLGSGCYQFPCPCH